MFIHGAGQAGADAWPRQAAEQEAGWFFLPRAGVSDDADRDARRAVQSLREAPALSDEELEHAVRRLRALKPPWHLGLRGLNANTLVITGGERPLYEQTAESLTKLGARHQSMDGSGHRVQDDPRTTPELRQWFSEQR